MKGGKKHDGGFDEVAHLLSQDLVLCVATAQTHYRRRFHYVFQRDLALMLCHKEQLCSIGVGKKVNIEVGFVVS